MDVGRIGAALPAATAADPAAGGAAPKKTTFGEVLKDSLAQVNHLQNEADRAIATLGSGKQTTLHDTMLALEKADLSFRLMMQVRNRIVQAYQDVLHMQI
ncbi:MAG TPA: flagellar hook-basal body complex protein FliE [Candidatus Binatia bacterium]|nr:flagellar hook-basal body complex protein FliE [Candidatus Binatia bacterium]